MPVILEKIRSDYGIYNNGSVWLGYTVDGLNQDGVCSALAVLGREKLKEQLGMLSPDFSALFASAPSFKNTKRENLYYIDILKGLLDTMLDIDKTDLIEIEEDYIYDMCAKLEKKASTVEDKEHLDFWVNLDAEDSVQRNLYDLYVEVKSLYNSCVYMYGSSDETLRKQEQRKREHIFVWTMMGLCFFFDVYMPVSIEEDFRFSNYEFERKIYSCLDVIALYNLNPYLNRGVFPNPKSCLCLWDAVKEYESDKDNPAFSRYLKANED